MRATPRRFEAVDDCRRCPWREPSFFCDFPAEVLEEFHKMTFTSIYPESAVLFVEGEQPRGVFILCKGRAKLTTSTSDGKTHIFRITEAGQILGLSATISGRPYRGTAETIEPSQFKFVRQPDFLRFLDRHGEAALRAAVQLSRELHDSFDQIRSLALSGSAAEKLCTLLLSRANSAGKETDGGIRLTLAMTHLEIAQLIGSSRETVTRVLSELRGQKIIESRGSTLIIRDRDRLEAVAHPVSS